MFNRYSFLYQQTGSNKLLKGLIMEIKGKVHCFFEQSGTFKNEFIKLGIPAEDYDIQNNFGETDHVIDLFGEIDRAYDNLTRHDTTIFDTISPCQDLIVAFYPCIYFNQASQTAFQMFYNNYQKLSDLEKIQKILERSEKRQEYYNRLIKFCYVCLARGIRMIFENPATEPHYLTNNFLYKPTVIDKNRMERGDYFKKPTAYWFFNCERTYGFSGENDKVQKKIKKSKSAPRAGLCSEERSLISPDYARNFICDFILGKVQNDNPKVEPSLF